MLIIILTALNGPYFVEREEAKRRGKAVSIFFQLLADPVIWREIAYD